MSAGGPSPPYRVTMNGPTRQAIRRLIHLSVLVGARNRLLQSLQEIEAALQNHPTTWGDPYDTRKALRLVQYRRVFDQLLVRYAVHQDEPLVWLTGVSPILRSPLCIGEG